MGIKQVVWKDNFLIGIFDETLNPHCETYNMIDIQIDTGICGFRTMIHVGRVKKCAIRIRVESDCSQVTELGNQLKDMGVMEILKGPIHQNPIYEEAGRCRVHSSCPVPCGIIKAAEVALGIALQKDVKIEFLKNDQKRMDKIAKSQTL